MPVFPSVEMDTIRLRHKDAFAKTRKHYLHHGVWGSRVRYPTRKKWYAQDVKRVDELFHRQGQTGSTRGKEPGYKAGSST